MAHGAPFEMSQDGMREGMFYLCIRSIIHKYHILDRSHENERGGCIYLRKESHRQKATRKRARKYPTHHSKSESRGKRKNASAIPGKGARAKELVVNRQ